MLQYLSLEQFSLFFKNRRVTIKRGIATFLFHRPTSVDTFPADNRGLLVSRVFFVIEQWFSNLSEVSNPTGVMQAYIEPLI